MSQNLQVNLEQRILELEEENRKLKLKTKYGLVWEDKPEKVVENCNTKFPVLKVKEGKKFKEIINDKNKPINILIEGDNYHALSVLNYTHKNSIDVIYIDPPYNTGNEDFIYNDNYVDREDSFRHSKWLSFIQKRLSLSKNLLSESGLIFISIDDNEQSQLKLLCDKIFGENNFLGNLVWENKEGGGKSDSSFFRIKHEYILVYAKNIKYAKIYGINIEDEDRYKLSDRYESTRGKYQLIKLDSASLGYVKSLDYAIKAPDGTNIFPNKDNKKISRWRWSKEKLDWGLKNDFVVVKKDSKGAYSVYTKQYLYCDNEGKIIERKNQPIGVIPYFSTTQSNRFLKEIFGVAKFNYSKPTDLIKFILRISSKNNSKILDFMAGSGTTGHAVLELNKEDDGNRQFILCTNNENKICEEVTFERITRVMNGYKNMKGEKVEGLGGNLKYLQTDLIEKTRHSDNMKMRLMRACTEMLCLKENAFQLEKEVKDGKTLMYKIFSGVKVENGNTKKHIVGIYYDLDDSYLDDIRTDLIGHGDLEKTAYIFSLRNVDDFIDDYRKWKGINIEEIPQKILEIYGSIFKNNSRNK